MDASILWTDIPMQNVDYSSIPFVPLQPSFDGHSLIRPFFFADCLGFLCSYVLACCSIPSPSSLFPSGCFFSGVRFPHSACVTLVCRFCLPWVCVEVGSMMKYCVSPSKEDYWACFGRRLTLCSMDQKSRPWTFENATCLLL